MKTRCRTCRTLIEYGKSHCSKCEEKYKKYKQQCKTKQTKEADKYVKAERWKALRREIIRRDKGCCSYCLNVNNYVEYRNLQVHHIVKRVDNLELAYEPSNLITVCRTCHEIVEKMPVSEQKKIFKLDKREEETHFLL